MIGQARKDNIRNECIQDEFGVPPIEEIQEKMTETQLRWFGHVRRRPMEFLVRKVDQMEDTLIKKGRKDLKNFKRNY